MVLDDYLHITEIMSSFWDGTSKLQLYYRRTPIILSDNNHETINASNNNHHSPQHTMEQSMEI
jgi:hypothetical protein